MARSLKEPRIVKPDDIDPHHNWARPIQAPGDEPRLRIQRQPRRKSRRGELHRAIAGGRDGEQKR